MTVVWEGPEVLRPYLIDVDELVPSEENARKGDVMALVGSLKRFTQVRPILVTPENKIVAGHHLRLAAIELGWTHIAAIPNEFENEVDRQAYLVADNALAQLGGYDEILQMSILEDLESRGGLEGTGVDSDTIENLRSAMEAVPTTEAPETWGGGYSETAEEAAARAEALSVSKQKREVLMMMDLDEYEQFGANVRILQQGFGTSGVKDTVVQAVAVAASGYHEEPAEVVPGVSSDADYTGYPE